MIPGLIYQDDFLTTDQECLLLDYIYKQKWNNSLTRRTQHYGYEYNYASRILKKTSNIPSQLKNLTTLNYDQIIINEYKKGQSISPHIDHKKLFDNEIHIISLHDDCIMKFTLGNFCKTLKLKRRSRLILKNEARYIWKHSLKYNGKNKRVSLTFRKTLI